MIEIKAEELNQECPNCGSTDKNISTVKNPVNKDKLKEANITEEQIIVGAINCSSCGYLFEYCREGKCVIEVKKINIHR